MSRRVLIAGCGDVGTAAGLLLDADEVWGLRRDPSQLPAPIHGIAGDLTRPQTLDAIPGRWDAVVYCPTPGQRSAAAYQAIFVDGLRALLARVRCRRLLLVSSTAVYAQDDGSWVDETSPAIPCAFNGEILLQAEGIARESVACTTVLRLAGIYGPGRDRLLRLAAAGAPVQARPPRWTNRIHRDDCARLLVFLLSRDWAWDVVIGVDDLPAPRHEVLGWLAARLGAPPPGLQARPAAGQNKRLSNRRLREAGFDFLHPDYRAGYQALLDDTGKAAG